MASPLSTKFCEVVHSQDKAYDLDTAFGSLTAKIAFRVRCVSGYHLGKTPSVIIPMF